MDGARATKQHVILIGYRGSGKTVVGRLLAEQLNRPHVETDFLVEEREGRTIADTFKQDGESYFRKIESEIIDRLSPDPPAVISVGGGAVLSKPNRKQLKELGVAVWLQAAPEELHRRITADAEIAASRPPLSTTDPLTEVRTLLAQRSEWYEELADITIDTDGKSTAEVAHMILRRLDPAVCRPAPQPAGDETKQDNG